MKKTIAMIIALLCLPLWGLGGRVWADDITAEEALQQAQEFLAKRQVATGGQHRVQAKVPQLALASTVSGLYVFNVADNGGYVIVSNDDGTVPVLGFSDSGSFDPDNMPDNMKAWLQGYANEIAWLKENANGAVSDASPVGSNTRAKARRKVGSHPTDAIPPLLTTTWDQDYPYNAFCPEYASGQESATGCVATAMAQVMYYTETKAGNATTATTAVIPAYKTESYHILMPAIPEGTTISWGDMIADYSNGYSSEAATAVAELMLYCGCSLEMDYGPTSNSHTAEVAKALKQYFGYESTAKYVSRSWYSYADWTDIIYNELEQGRPVLYGGQSIDNGHAFVCDGYKYDEEDDIDYFHINWGWGGHSDEYYVLSVLAPTTQGIGGSSTDSPYDSGQDAIVGIQKIGGEGTVLEKPTYDFNLLFNNITASHSKIALGESVDITVNVQNGNTDRAFDGELCLVVNDALGVGKMFVIPAGATEDCTISFTPKEAGDYTVGISYLYPASSAEDHHGQYDGVDDLSTSLTVVNQTPTDLAISNITSETATLSWTNVGEATEWKVNYRPLTITTEDFNGSAEQIFSIGNWESYDANDQGDSWVVAPGEGIDGTQCVKSASFKDGQNIDPYVWLISPKIDFDSRISFWVWGSSDCVENFSVWASANGTNFRRISSDVYSADKKPDKCVIDLSTLGIDEGWVAIIHQNSTESTSESYLFVDDFTVITGAGGMRGIATDAANLRITGLTKQSAYEVKVQALNNDGGNWSEPFIFTTTDNKLTLADNDSELAQKNTDLIEMWNNVNVVDVTLAGRTLWKDGGWNTLYLPFEVVKSASPLVDAEVQRLTSASLVDGTLTLNFSTVGYNSYLVPGVPYIVRWSSGEDLVNPVFTNAYVSDEHHDFTSTDGKVQFKGIFSPVTLVANDRSKLYFGADNQLYYPASDVTLNAFRAYFQLSDGTQGIKEFKLRFDDGTEESTGIMSIENGKLIIENDSDAWYTLSGMRLEGKPVKKGVYIRGGRKVVVQ